MKDFKKLLVWEKAHALTLAIYGQTAGFPREAQRMLSGLLRTVASTSTTAALRKSSLGSELVASS